MKKSSYRILYSLYMKTPCRFIYFLLISLPIGCGSGCCTADYKNESTYQIQEGETVRIFVKENSCCTHCWINEDEAIAVKYVRKKIARPAPSNCDGCNTIYFWEFEGVSVGTDTIKIAKLSGGQHCEEYQKNETDNGLNTYTITVN